jgi:hypothetical protein
MFMVCLVRHGRLRKVCADLYDKRSKQARAATSVASITGVSCAADTKPVS